MICYLVRHGQDDETVRGGWSQTPLTERGIQQAEKLAEDMASLTVGKIYSSDLKRAMQTARIIGDKLALPVTEVPQFREVDNGDLAGMKNTLASERYPGLFWNQLDWDQCYPNGESPRQFYERVSSAWEKFSSIISMQKENVILVTHGGVIHIIRALCENRHYSNRDKQRRVAHTEVVPLSFERGMWKEI